MDATVDRCCITEKRGRSEVGHKSRTEQLLGARLQRRGGAVGYTYADPWVLQGLLSRDPLGWVDGQHLVDQVFGLWGDGVPLRGRELEQQHKGTPTT